MLCSVMFPVLNIIAKHNTIGYLLKARNNILSPSYSPQLGLCWTLLSGHRVIWLHHYIYGTVSSGAMLCRTPQAKTMLQTGA